MLCIQPLIELKSKELKEKYGKRFISYKWYEEKNTISKSAYSNNIGVYPCNRCLPCIGIKRFHWVKKMQLEAKYWKYKYFITLTYSPENIPHNHHLNKQHLKNFIKYFRKHTTKANKSLKYFACGEYGGKTERPHYHIILFTDYQLDLQELKTTKTGILYNCNLLNKCWLNKGHIWTAIITDTKCFSYVASYSNKNHIRQEYNNKSKLLTNIINQIKYINKDKQLNGFLMYEAIHNRYIQLNFRQPEFFLYSKKIPLGAIDKNINSPKSLLKWLYKQNIQNHYYKYNQNITIDNIEELTPYIDNTDPYYNQLQLNKQSWNNYLKNTNIQDTITNNKILLDNKNKNTKNTKNII